MKKLTIHQLIRCIATYHFLSFFMVFLMIEVNGAFGKPDVKTKLLLQNIRTHLAQKADEIIKERECELGLILCKSSKSKEEEGEEEKIRPAPKIAKGQHKPLIRVKPKDITQTLLPKVHKSLHRKTQKDGENDKHRKFFHSLETSKNLESDEKSEEEESKDSKTHFEPPKQQPIKTFHKLRKVEENKKPPKVEKKDLKSDTNSQMESLKQKIKTKEEVTIKSRKKLKDDSKSVTVKPMIKKVKKITVSEPIKEDFIFSNGGFVFVIDSDNAQRKICEKHSQIFIKQLKKYEMWALMMYDASAKLSSGVLQGNANQYGDFDECLSINAIFKKSKNKSKEFPGIKGKYCLANIDIRTDSDNKNIQKLNERIESFRFVKSTINDPPHFIPRFSTLNWGLCVPSTCQAENVEKFLKSQLEAVNNATGLVFDVKVEDDNCVVKDDLKFQFHMETLITLLFYFSVLFISLYATFMDSKGKQFTQTKEKTFEKESSEPAQHIDSEISRKNDEGLSYKEKGKRIIMAFSLKKNIEKLLSEENKGNIECINGIKSIFTIFLYFAHKTIPLGMMPFSNRIFLTKISNQPATVFLRSSIVYTDSFLLISGILTAYSLAKELSEKREISWIKKSLARIIRLTPPLFAVVLFYAFIWDQLGSGPNWNLIVKKNALLCRRHMWRNLFYVQNLFEFENMCAPQTHQLALDMQLSLLGPVFVHLMHSYDKLGIGILQALFFLSSILRYTSTSRNNLSVVIYHGMPVSQLYATANLLYAQAIHRASPYILGTIVGYHLKKYENQNNIPKVLAVFGWTIALIFGYYSLLSPFKTALKSYQYNVQEAAQYAALSPIAWSLALSWIIVACHLGLGGKINQFLCNKVFLLLSRISYSVYLTQFLVFFYKIGVTKIPERFSFAGSFNITEFVVVIVVSVILTLLFDIPSMEIKKILLDGRSTKKFQDNFPESDDFESVGKKEYEMVLNENLLETAKEQITDEKYEGKYEEEELNENYEGEDRAEEGEENEEEYEGEEGEEYEGEYEEEDAEEDEDETREEYEEENREEDIEEDEEDKEGSDEKADEENDEVIEAVFKIRPLKRSNRMHFSEEHDDKECFKVEPETEDDGSK